MTENSFQSMTASNFRYRALDGYRFLAALCVALYHYNLDFGLGLERFSPAVLRFNALVDLFFVLSGFVIGVSYLERIRNSNDYVLFLRARLARVYPLHVVAAVASLSLVAVSALAHVPANHPEIIALPGLPANLLLIHAWGVLDHLSFNTPSWSISAEWLVYLLVPLFFFLARRISLVSSLAITAVFVAAMILLRPSAGLGPWTEATYDFGAFRAIPSFFVGVLIAANLSRAPFAFRPPWWCAHGLFLAAIVVLHADLRREIVIVLFAALVLAAALAERSGRPTVMAGRLLTKLGDASYSIYMLHVLASVPVLFLARRLGLIGVPMAGAIALLTLGAVIFLSIQVHARFEAPMRRRFAGRGAKGAAEERRATGDLRPIAESERAVAKFKSESSCA